MLNIANPGNIRYSQSVDWKGQIGHTEGFVIFDTTHNGLRALAKVLHSYMYKDYCYSLASYIERWAPPGENDTTTYLRNISNWSRWPIDHIILPSDIPDLMGFITRQENGINPYDVIAIKAAFDDAWEC